MTAGSRGLIKTPVLIKSVLAESDINQEEFLSGYANQAHSVTVILTCSVQMVMGYTNYVTADKDHFSRRLIKFLLGFRVKQEVKRANKNNNDSAP
jgi:hypothetical protein